MLFKSTILEGIRAGAVTIAFRRWTRPTVRAGGTLRTAVGVLAIESVACLAEERISERDAVMAGYSGREALLRDLRARPDGTVYRIAFRLAGSDPREALRGRGSPDPIELTELQARLAALDRAARGGAWTLECLRLIGAREGRPAAELAVELGLDKPKAKRRIRQLKELGLTESLKVGYRLSPRGRALLKSFGGGR